MIYLWFIAFGGYLLYSAIRNRQAKNDAVPDPQPNRVEDPIERWLSNQGIGALVHQDGPVNVYGFDFNIHTCRIKVEIRHDRGTGINRVKIAFPVFFPLNQWNLVTACLDSLNRRLSMIQFRQVTSEQRSMVFLNCDQLVDSDGKAGKPFRAEDLYLVFNIADMCFPEIQRAAFGAIHPELASIRVFGLEDFRMN